MSSSRSSPPSRVAGVDPEREQPWTVYALSVIAFSAVKTRGYEVDVAPTGELALALAAKRHPDLVILDLGLPGGERDTDEVPRRGAGEVLVLTEDPCTHRWPVAPGERR